MTNTNKPERVQCPECCAQILLNKDGILRRHLNYTKLDYCPGSGRYIATEKRVYLLMTNYITALQNERDSLRAEVERLRAGMGSVKSYLMSDKFASCDPIERAVNPDDIILRINEVLYGDN